MLSTTGLHEAMEDSINFVKYIYSRERIDQVAALNTGKDVPIFLPRQHWMDNIVIQAPVLTVAVFLLFAVLVQACQKVNGRQQRYKLAYRLTNILVTMALGGIGLYGELVVLPTLPADDVAPYVQGKGLEDHVLILNLMFGFQVWAMVVGGSKYIGESPLMMLHHTAVIMGCIMFATFTNGFRHHMFYFTGVWEISSIPLAIMNILRDHPQWKDRIPGLFFLTKTSFAFSFLILRIWIGTRRAIRYTTDVFVIFTTVWDKALWYRAWMCVMAPMSLFLALLQFYWAALIIGMIGRTVGDILTQQMKKLKVT